MPCLVTIAGKRKQYCNSASMCEPMCQTCCLSALFTNQAHCSCRSMPCAMTNLVASRTGFWSVTHRKRKWGNAGHSAAWRAAISSATKNSAVWRGRYFAQPTWTLQKSWVFTAECVYVFGIYVKSIVPASVQRGLWTLLLSPLAVPWRRKQERLSKRRKKKMKSSLGSIGLCTLCI